MKNRIFIMICLILLSGCSTIKVQKADGKKGEGMSFYLPKTIMKLVPDKDLGYKVHWEVVADESKEFRIKQTTSWATSNTKINTYGKMLQSIVSTSDSSALAEKVIQGYTSVQESEVKNKLTLAKAEREKAEEELQTAKTDRDNIKKETENLRESIPKLETAIITARQDELDKQRTLNSKNRSLDLAQQRLADANRSLDSSNQDTITAVRNAEAAVETARVAVDVATSDYEKAQQAHEAAIKAKEMAETKLAEKEKELVDAEAKVLLLATTLPPKYLAESVEASDAASLGDSNQQQDGATKTVSRPVIFSLEISNDNHPKLVPVEFMVSKRSPYKQGTFERTPPVQLKPKDTENQECSEEKAKAPPNVEANDKGEWWHFKLEVQCKMPDDFIVEVKLVNADGSKKTIDGFPLSKNETIEAKRFTSVVEGDKSVIKIGIDKKRASDETLKSLCSASQDTKCGFLAKDNGETELWYTDIKFN